jgi:hypothetical protein
MSESKLKHLEFIQNAVTRTNSNSFQLKGWSITLVAAIFAVALTSSAHLFAFVAILPIFSFWGLDAYYLLLERRYRMLYNDVASKQEIEINFSMDASVYEDERTTLFCCAFCGHIPVFYGTLSICSVGMGALFSLWQT